MARAKGRQAEKKPRGSDTKCDRKSRRRRKDSRDHCPEKAESNDSAVPADPPSSKEPAAQDLLSDIIQQTVGEEEAARRAVDESWRDTIRSVYQDHVRVVETAYRTALTTQERMLRAAIVAASREHRNRRTRSKQKRERLDDGVKKVDPIKRRRNDHHPAPHTNCADVSGGSGDVTPRQREDKGTHRTRKRTRNSEI